MAYYEQLLQMGCFTRDDVAALTGNVKTADTVLYSHKKKGLVVSVKRNLYAAISLETKQPVITPFEIASHITEGAYLSHHSAFEYNGMANQVFAEIYVSSPTRFSDFEFDGKTFEWISSKIELGITSPARHIRVTSVERTIIDSIKDFPKIGGLEELLRCLSMVTYVNEAALLSVLEAYGSQFLYQKTGYILSHYKAGMKLSDAFFDVCKAKINKSVRYLYNGIQYEEPQFYSEWQLFAPADLMKLIDEGGDAIV